MTGTSELAPLVDALEGARVLCVGDVMLDRFVYGEVTRVSPEAPIPVCRVAEETAMLGGAGNVVRNLAALGATVEAVLVVGDDEPGREVTRLVDGLAGVTAAVTRTPAAALRPTRPTMPPSTPLAVRLFSGIGLMLSDVAGRCLEGVRSRVRVHHRARSSSRPAGSLV